MSELGWGEAGDSLMEVHPECREPRLVANYRVGELSAGRFAAEEPVCAL